MKKKHFRQYQDQIYRIYQNYDDYSFALESLRNITFQITDTCNCACTYCYQIGKSNRMMTKEVAKQGVDLLFKMWEKDDPQAFINKNTHTIVLDFIGGEPLLNIDIIEYICSYFIAKCLELHHPWLHTVRFSMISNGKLYFNEKVQNFLSKYKNFCSFSVTLDGPKELHNACRIYPDGIGNFDDAYKAIMHYKENYNSDIGTKVTIAPENLDYLDTIVKFFIDNGFKDISANPIFEQEWTLEQGQKYYKKLTEIADYLLEKAEDDIYISLFDTTIGKPMDETDISNWCGGNMKMLAFDPDGIAYPCIRYMKSSLGDSVPELPVGSVNGLFITEEEQANRDNLACIDRRTQSTDECFYCPVASGCAWCQAWNYQYHGELNKRCTSICWMHKARVAANYYYWNKYFKNNNIDEEFILHLSEEDYIAITGEKL